MTKTNNLSENKLSAEYLVSNGFKLIEESPFRHYPMQYFVKNAVVLFFNTPVYEWDCDKYLIGFAEQRMGIYSVVTFRWISTQNELIQIYETITGRTLTSNHQKNNDETN